MPLVLERHPQESIVLDSLIQPIIESLDFLIFILKVLDHLLYPLAISLMPQSMSLDYIQSIFSGLADLLLHSQARILQQFLFNQPVGLLWVVKVQAMLCSHLY
jgi:hypothetical protein